MLVKEIRIYKINLNLNFFSVFANLSKCGLPCQKVVRLIVNARNDARVIDTKIQLHLVANQ